MNSVMEEVDAVDTPTDILIRIILVTVIMENALNTNAVTIMVLLL